VDNGGTLLSLNGGKTWTNSFDGYYAKK